MGVRVVEGEEQPREPVDLLLDEGHGQILLSKGKIPIKSLALKVSGDKPSALPHSTMAGDVPVPSLGVSNEALSWMGPSQPLSMGFLGFKHPKGLEDAGLGWGLALTWSHRAICRVFQRETPVVSSRFVLPRNTTRLTRWFLQLASCRTGVRHPQETTVFP